MKIEILVTMSLFSFYSCNKSQTETESPKTIEIKNKIEQTENKISKTSENNNSTSKEFTDDLFELISGEYDGIYNTEQSISNVKIKYIGNRNVEFEIFTATESGCVGNVSGTVTIDNYGKGKYSEEECESLEFVFNSEKLSINENNCGLHGMRCFFSGEYEKVKQ